MLWKITKQIVITQLYIYILISLYYIKQFYSLMEQGKRSGIIIFCLQLFPKSKQSRLFSKHFVRKICSIYFLIKPVKWDIQWWTVSTSVLFLHMVPSARLYVLVKKNIDFFNSCIRIFSGLINICMNMFTFVYPVFLCIFLFISNSLFNSLYQV